MSILTRDSYQDRMEVRVTGIDFKITKLPEFHEMYMTTFQLDTAVKSVNRFSDMLGERGKSNVTRDLTLTGLDMAKVPGILVESDDNLGLAIIRGGGWRNIRLCFTLLLKVDIIYANGAMVTERLHHYTGYSEMIDRTTWSEIERAGLLSGEVRIPPNLVFILNQVTKYDMTDGRQRDTIGFINAVYDYSVLNTESSAPYIGDIKEYNTPANILTDMSLNRSHSDVDEIIHTTNRTTESYMVNAMHSNPLSYLSSVVSSAQTGFDVALQWHDSVGAYGYNIAATNALGISRDVDPVVEYFKTNSFGGIAVFNMQTLKTVPGLTNRLSPSIVVNQLIENRIPLDTEHNKYRSAHHVVAHSVYRALSNAMHREGIRDCWFEVNKRGGGGSSVYEVIIQNPLPVFATSRLPDKVWSIAVAMRTVELPYLFDRYGADFTVSGNASTWQYTAGDVTIYDSFNSRSVPLAFPTFSDMEVTPQITDRDTQETLANDLSSYMSVLEDNVTGINTSSIVPDAIFRNDRSRIPDYL